MKISKINIFIINIFALLFFTGCSSAKEPVIEYHNNFSTPIDVIKTFQYAIYSRNRDLLISCFSLKTQERSRKIYADDPNINNANRNIVYFDLEKAEIKTYFLQGQEKATVEYSINENKGMEYLLFKEGDRWYIL